MLMIELNKKHFDFLYKKIKNYYKKHELKTFNDDIETIKYQHINEIIEVLNK